MDQGQVAELGQHSALVAKGGIYANLVRRQLDGFISTDDMCLTASNGEPRRFDGTSSPERGRGDSRGRGRGGRRGGQRGGR